jgi:uncharacterized caspase-like protein
MVFRAVILALTCVIAAAVAPAQAQDRVALVIGNSQYRDGATRPQAAGDAAAVADMLRSMNFAVTAGTDLDRDGMVRMIEQFRSSVAHARLAFFFFGGRGIQLQGSNFLLPVDAAPKKATDLEATTIILSPIIELMTAEKLTSLLFLDMDRNNPLATSLRIGSPSPFAETRPGEGTLIAFSTAPGASIAIAKGPHSPFVTAMLKRLPAPDLDIYRTIDLISRDVMAATDGQQTPWLSAGPISGSVKLIPAQPSDGKP